MRLDRSAETSGKCSSPGHGSIQQSLVATAPQGIFLVPIPVPIPVPVWLQPRRGNRPRQAQAARAHPPWPPCHRQAHAHHGKYGDSRKPRWIPTVQGAKHHNLTRSAEEAAC